MTRDREAGPLSPAIPDTHPHRSTGCVKPYSPWCINVATARRFGYPIVTPSRLDTLEARVRALEDAQALRDGLELLDGAL